MGLHSPRHSRWRRTTRLARTAWMATLVVLSVVVLVHWMGGRPAITAAPSKRPLAAPAPSPSPTPTTSPRAGLPPTPSPEAFAPPSGPRAPVYTHIDTKDNVVFITMDDGYLADPRVRDIVVQNHLPVTLFLVTGAARQHHDYFKQMIDAGATVEDHTMTHPQLTKLGIDAQMKQICGARDSLEKQFGYRPVLFRPPYGAFNDTTRVAARRCGMKAMFTWSASMNYGYIDVADKNLSAGEVILMHFRPDTYDNLTNLLKELKKRHLGVGRLEDYVGIPA